MCAIRAFTFVFLLFVVANNVVASSPPVPTSFSSEGETKTLAAGTFLDPRSWGDESFPGAVHGGPGRFFVSKFSGSASGSSMWYPADEKSNSYWAWGGTHLGTPGDPKDPTEYSYPGAFHKSANYFYISLFSGNASQSDKPFPAAGASNAFWTSAGVHAGTPDDPKNWGDYSYPGAFHGSGTRYYVSRFSGSAADKNWYFPARGQSDSHWTWAGEHRGTFDDPKTLHEPSYIGAIHGRDVTARIMLKSLADADRASYPDSQEIENAGFRMLAIDCPYLDSVHDGAEANALAKPMSKEVQQVVNTVLQEINDMRRIHGLEALSASPPTEGAVYGIHEVDAALLHDPTGFISGSIIVVNRNDGGYLVLSDAPGKQGLFQFDRQGYVTFVEDVPYDPSAPDTIALAHDGESVSTRAFDDASSFDCSGKRLVDVFAGFSQDAAKKISDASAYALAQIESTNVGLRNSKVDSVRVRLAGVAIYPENLPMSALSKVPDLLKMEVEETHADLGTYFVVFETGNGNTVGMGNVDGRWSMNQVTASNVLRHELGHNVGGRHCNSAGADDYKFGYGKSILCGVAIPYYSTPLVSDAADHPLGNARTADMARLWRERARKMSSYQKQTAVSGGTYP